MRIKVSPRVGAVLGPLFLRALASTWRMRREGSARWDAARASGRPLVMMCWHESLLPLVWNHRGQGITLVVSEARDGGYLADLGTALGYRLVRGSSTRGGTRALLGAVRELEEGHTVAFTPDGPRGPRREMKPGVAAAAQRSGALIIGLHAVANRAWRFRSWDRFALPQPFARVTVRYSEPFEVGPGSDGIADGLTRATDALAALTGDDP
ncbi:MAG: lysophospholipid acyltransferase family protein [Gemmatimonadales bacterium]